MRILTICLMALISIPAAARAGDASVKTPDTLMTGKITPEDPESVEKVQAKTIKDDNPDASGLPKDTSAFNRLPSEDDMPEGSNQVGNYEDSKPMSFNDPSATVEEKEVQAGPKRIHVNQTD